MGNRIITLLAILAVLASCETGRRNSTLSVQPTVLGVDVSHHNGTIDWKAIAAKDSMQFVFIKATEGATVIDGMFSKYLSGAKAAGLKVGAYHFHTTSSDAESQFDSFRKVAKKGDIDLIPVLDAERMTRGHQMSAEAYVSHVRKWADLCREHYGKAPILYCSREHYRRYFKNGFKDCMFWCGDVDASRDYVDGESWVIWQRSIEKCHGSQSRLDVNELAPGRTLLDISLISQE